MALKLEVDPSAAAEMLEDGPQASKGPFGKGGALEWVAIISDALSAVTLTALHAFDDKAVQDSSKNLQVLWSRATLAHAGDLKDDIAYELLPESTRGVVKNGWFDGLAPFLEWVQARTEWLDQGTEAFLSSPACADGADCQIVILGAGFDTRSIRYQREGLQIFEVDLPDTIAAKTVVQERYKASKPETRLPTRVGWDLNDCEDASLIDHLEERHGFVRGRPTLFISEAVLFYVNPQAIANLYNEIFTYGQSAEAMYCFTDSMRPFVGGPFADEAKRFFRQQDVQLLSHTSRWSGAVQFVHAVAMTPKHAIPEGQPSLLQHVKPIVEAPVNSYAPERRVNLETAPSFNNTWYAIAYESELQTDAPYATRLFGEPITLLRAANGDLTCRCRPGQGEAPVEYVVRSHQDLIWIWRGAPTTADERLLPTHPTPEATHSVETILDYGCDWKYIVENNLDTPHLYWLHDGSIPPIESLGCSRKNVGSIGLRFFKDDIGIGHIGKTSKKVTKVVRYDAPNVVRHGGVSGFSEEFNIIPIGPHRTRVLLRQRFPKGPILSTLLQLPFTAAILQYLVRQWNYQIGLEDYSVMQGQAHNIDDFGAPNWQGLSTGDDLIVKFWKWKSAAFEVDRIDSEYFTRWDGSTFEPADTAAAGAPARQGEAWGGRMPTPANDIDYLKEGYLQSSPVADYPPINYRRYQREQDIWSLGEKLRGFAPNLGIASVLGASSGLIAASVAGSSLAKTVDLVSGSGL